MPEGLQIQVGADLSQAEKAFADFAKDAETAGKRAADGLAGPLEKIPTAANKAAVALKKIPSASNQATQSMVNLGRVIQDAPFGFIGIANNLNPLIEGFGRLKATTGGIGGAFKALGSSMLGPGGIGLAVSLVSSALVLFGDKLFGAGKAAKQASEALDAASQKFAGQITTLTSLVGVVQNVNSAYGDKVKAIKAINQEYGEYLKSLGIEELTVSNIGEAYKKMVDQMLRQAVVKGLQDQISKAVEETAKKMLELQVAQEKQRIAEEQRQKAAAKAPEDKQRKNLENLSQSIQIYRQGARDGFIAQQDFNEEQARAVGTTNLFEEGLANLKKKLMEQVQPLLNLTSNFEDLGITLKDVKGKADKFDLGEALKGVKAPLKFDGLLKIQRLDILGIKFNIAEVEKRDIDILREKLEKGISARPAQVSVDIKLSQEKLNEVKQQFDSFAADINNSLKSIGVDSLANIGDVIGQALTGGNLGNVFQGFAEIVGSGLQQIGKQLIQVGLLAKISQKALSQLFFNPGLAIATGIALSAAGAALKNAFKGGIKGFAQGGLVFGPTVGMVGEGFNTRRSNPEVIAPLDKLRSMIGEGGGSAVRVVVTGRLRGNDMALMNARTSRKNGRLGG